VIFRRFVSFFVLVFLAAACVEAGQRIIAIGDVHGSYEGLVSILVETEIIDNEQNWIADDLILVQVGDLLDRGRDVRQVMDLLIRLQNDAKEHQSQVIVLLGNHEALNLLGILRDVNAEVYATFADRRSKRRRKTHFRAFKHFWLHRAGQMGDDAPTFDGVKEQWYETHPPGFIEYIDALSADGRYGQWLRTCPTSVKIGDTVFIHGGPGPALRGSSIDEINERITSELAAFDLVRSWCEEKNLVLELSSIHELVQATDPVANNPELDFGLDLPDDVKDAILLVDSWQDWFLIDPDGPLWFRGAAMWDESRQEDIDALMSNLDARRVVVGHTPQRTGAIRGRFDNRVFLIDTGMLKSVYKGGQPSALEIIDDTISAIYVGKKELLFDPNMPTPPLTEEAEEVQEAP